MHPSRVALSPQKPDSTERNYFLGLNNKTSQPGQFKQQTFILSQSGGWKSGIKVSSGLVSPESSLLGM